MATWIWIVIAIAAVVALAVLVFGGRRAKERRVRQHREKAQELRQEAAQRHSRAKEHETLSQELAERAKVDRKEGDKAAAHAARVDPDRDCHANIGGPFQSLTGRGLMKTLFRSSVVTLAAAAALALPAAASARPASTSFGVVGYEYAFTQTVGSFAGSATGTAGDSGLWNARVEHDPLGSQPTYINGGTFEMTTVRGFSADFVTGDFLHHGGQITVLDPGAGCTNQQFRVEGALKNVATSTTSGGRGLFSVTLTHYRASLFGHCVIYKARVAGGVSFVY